MTFCLCMCLLGIRFIGAPNNITVWVELAEISRGNTWTSDTTTCKHTYVCTCVLEQKYIKNPNPNPMKNLSSQKHSLRSCLFFHFLKDWTHTMFLKLLLRYFMLCPSFLFSPLENAKTLEIFWCGLVTFHIPYYFPVKKSWKTGKS